MLLGVKALLIIAIFGGLAIKFFQPIAVSNDWESKHYRNLLTVWLAVSASVFITGSFWLFVCISFMALAWLGTRSKNPLSSFAFMLFAAPVFSLSIPGFGVFESLFEISYLRLLSLVLLAPFVWRLANQDGLYFGRFWADRFLLIYLAIQFFLTLSVGSLTGTIRVAAFNPAVDILLPYLAASRGLKTLKDIRDVMLGLCMGLGAMAAVSIYEMATSWLIYESAADLMRIGRRFGTSYLDRGGFTRMVGSTGQAIAFGVSMMVGLICALSLKPTETKAKRAWYGMVALLTFGLIASISKGPIGMAVIGILIYYCFGKNAFQRFSLLAVVGFTVAAIYYLTPLKGLLTSDIGIEIEEGDGVWDYRQRLLEVTIQLVRLNPWFGAYDYMSNPAMEGLRQGQGIIDIVNTYAGIALTSGLSGLSTFLAIFATILWAGARRMTNGTVTGSFERTTGQALIASLLACMFVIFSVSSISVIPVIYWLLAGLTLRYCTLATPADTSLRRRGYPPLK
jgi:O-antigen ligase